MMAFVYMVNYTVKCSTLRKIRSIYKSQV